MPPGCKGVAFVSGSLLLFASLFLSSFLSLCSGLQLLKRGFGFSPGDCGDSPICGSRRGSAWRGLCCCSPGLLEPCPCTQMLRWGLGEAGIGTKIQQRQSLREIPSSGCFQELCVMLLEHLHQRLAPQQGTRCRPWVGDFLTSFSFAVSWDVLFCISSFRLSSPSSSSGCSNRTFCFSLAGVRGGVCVVETWSRKQSGFW